MRLIILTGASGAGKTAITKKLSERHSAVQCFFFDSIGVPPVEQMIAEYGSGEGWQRGKTIEWLAKIKAENLSGPVLFEGQSRISFIQEALKANEIEVAEIVLVDCNDAIRDARLRGPRAQPDLSNPQMMNWARYLREEAQKANLVILDTSNRSIDESVELLARKLGL
jgi:shikimate kinase